MFVFDWFRDLFISWGLMNKTAKILFLGLDNAGKTTLLHLLRDNSLSQHRPTRNPTNEELIIGDVTFTAYDLGGHQTARKIWTSYFEAVDGVVFLVDVADVQRLSEAKEVFRQLLHNEELADVPFLVLANKIDKIGALNKPQFDELFNIHDHGRRVEIFMCSVTQRQGYSDGFRWLSQFIK